MVKINRSLIVWNNLAVSAGLTGIQQTLFNNVKFAARDTHLKYFALRNLIQTDTSGVFKDNVAMLYVTATLTPTRVTNDFLTYTPVSGTFSNDIRGILFNSPFIFRQDMDILIDASMTLQLQAEMLFKAATVAGDNFRVLLEVGWI